MGDVIVLSSDNDEEDSDVEIVGSYRDFRTKADPPPLSEVRVDVDALNINVPTQYINLTDPKWTLPDLKLRKRKKSPPVTVVDLTENDTENVEKQETPDNGETKKESTINDGLKEQGYNLKVSSSSGQLTPEQDRGNLREKERHFQTNCENLRETTVKLKRIQLLETHVNEMKPASSSDLLKTNCLKMTLNMKQLDEETQCTCDRRRTTTSNALHAETKEDKPPLKMTETPVRQEQQENSIKLTNKHLNVEISQSLQSVTNFSVSDREGAVRDFGEDSTSKDANKDFSSEVHISTLSSPFLTNDKSHSSFQREDFYSSLGQQKSNETENTQSFLSDHSSNHFPANGPNPSEPADVNSQLQSSLKSQGHTSPVYTAATSGHKPTVDPSDLQTEEFKAEGASNSSDLLHWDTSGRLPLSEPGIKEIDSRFESGQYIEDLESDSALSFLWQEGIDESQEETESRFDLDFRAASQEDKHFVCPVALRKIMSGQAQFLVDEQKEGFRSPKMLCRQSLSLVYSTIDENYPEGTLQLLSDLLQPGYYPPRNITVHLLHGILLDPQCPYHLCVQAFKLLMRTQRHHMADKTTVPWDWESLTTVVTNHEPQNLLQDLTKKHQTKVVRMLLEYVVQTLEDDFQAKRSSSTIHHSIASATLSCDKQFHRVRDVMQWLISAIMKSTEHGERKELSRERDEQIRMVSILQRMLSLAVEVDRTPALTSAKLSQELFHMLIGSMPLRAHRMLLLESLQSKLLRSKLLEHLLDYACPLKIPLPMSLSLLLHFLRHCTLAPDPTDGNEKWKKWEELIHLLWMMILSYNKAMKGYLCSTGGEQGGKVGTLVYKQDDKISKAAVREAAEAFLSRSKADLNQDLPLHVEESLSYLQDYLLDACQC
ncbi:uncharacterized protein simc1 [Halichoeres trimaculatus]|uniref:uncharacterized protein simc1 n=1 Tax=Halichoeres trimaculatus TaxID=147232 RepID=UPI003D9F0EF5